MAVVCKVLLFELLAVGAASNVSFIFSYIGVLLLAWSWRGSVVNWRSCHSWQGIWRSCWLFKQCLWICRWSWMTRGSWLHLLLWRETIVDILRANYSLYVLLVLITRHNTHPTFCSLLLLIKGWCLRIPLIVYSRSAFYRAWIFCMIVIYWLFFVVIVVQRSKFLIIIGDFDRWSTMISITIMRIVCWLAQSFSLVLTRKGWFRLNFLSAIIDWLFIGFQFNKISQSLVSVGQFDAVWCFKLICLGWRKVWCSWSSNWTLLLFGFQNTLGWWVRTKFLLFGIKAHILLLSSCHRSLTLIFVFLISVLLLIWRILLNVKLLAVLFFIELNSFVWSLRLRRIWCVETFFSGSSGLFSSILLVFTERNTLLVRLIAFRDLLSF